MIRWPELTESAVFSRLDRRLGDLFYRLDPSDHRDISALTGALLSLLRRRGHSCLQLADYADKRFTSDSSAIIPRLPEESHWQRALSESSLCRTLEPSDEQREENAAVRPLVLDGSGRVYLYRHWSAEQALATQVLARTSQANSEPEIEAHRDLLAKLFGYNPDQPTTEPEDINWQACAVIAALRSPFAVITGGPGTGKTTTVVRLLALCLQHNPDLKIALAAPTGKAAARLSESILDQTEALPIEESLRQAIPDEVTTLHRLLGYRPFDDSFRHGREHPLPYDLCIVDEASMIDLGMMAVLFAAAGPKTRIVLLGDPDQLASVDTGYVLGDLCATSTSREGHSQDFADFYAKLSGQQIPVACPPSPLSDAVVCLRKNYRFAKQPGIGSLSEAIRIGDADSTLAILNDSEDESVSLSPSSPDLRATIAPILDAFDRVLCATDVETALIAFGRAQILCAVKRGARGVEGFNKAVERALEARGHRLDQTFYRGRPVMVTANDYATQLFNGDIGICWPDDDGTMQVCFPDLDAPRRVSLARLPPHETAWAMTVHKSQGSEFGSVLLVLPESDHPLCTRELLYTGITRARERVLLSGSRAAVSTAVASSAQRHGGLVAAIMNRSSAT